MKKLLQENLFAKIGIGTLAITLVLLFFLFHFLAFRVVEADNHAKTITAHLTSQGVVDKIDRNFYERFGDVQAFAFNHLARQTLDSGKANADIQLFINTMTTYYVLYDLMMICDLNGNVLVSNTIDKKGVAINTQPVFARNYQQEEWFKACTSGTGPEGGAWYSDFMINPQVASMYKSDGYGMAFAAPIRNSAGNVTGVWYNYASWREVTQAIRTEAEAQLRKSDPDATILVTTNDGQMIDATNGDLVLRGLRLKEDTTTEAGIDISEANLSLPVEDFVGSWATAHGAYTYQGNHWKALTLLSGSTISWGTFLSRELLPVILVTLLIVAAVGTCIFLYFSKEITGKINEVKQTLEALAQGELVNVPQVSGVNEIAKMMHSLNHLVESLRQKAAFSDEIAKGDLNTQLPVVSRKDMLGTALLNMRDKLKRAAEEDRRRNWTVEGLARFGELMRVNRDLKELCDQLLIHVVRYLQANQGSLFVTQQDEQDATRLELIACYAYNRKKYLQKSILPGQGLVGQAYLEGEVIYMTDIPQGYISITSGLGEEKASCILIVPLKVNDVIEGILELASFRPYEPYQIEFVVKLAENIASTLGAAQINAKTRLLLEQSQQQAEIMRAQEEEMKQNLEEMQATQEEYHRKEREYLQQIRQLQEKLATVEP